MTALWDRLTKFEEDWNPKELLLHGATSALDELTRELEELVEHIEGALPRQSNEPGAPSIAFASGLPACPGWGAGQKPLSVVPADAHARAADDPRDGARMPTASGPGSDLQEMWTPMAQRPYHWICTNSFCRNLGRIQVFSHACPWCGAPRANCFQFHSKRASAAGAGFWRGDCTLFPTPRSQASVSTATSSTSSTGKNIGNHWTCLNVWCQQLHPQALLFCSLCGLRRAPSTSTDRQVLEA